MSVSEALLHRRLHLFLLKELEVAGREPLRVLDVVGHGAHNEGRDLLPVEAVPVKDVHDLHVLAIDNHKEIVLILSLIVAFLAEEFYLTLLEQLLVLVVEVLQEVLLVEDGLAVEELDLLLAGLLRVPEVVEPTGHEYVLIMFVQFFVRHGRDVAIVRRVGLVGVRALLDGFLERVARDSDAAVVAEATHPSSVIHWIVELFQLLLPELRDVREELSIASDRFLKAPAAEHLVRVLIGKAHLRKQLLLQRVERQIVDCLVFLMFLFFNWRRFTRNTSTHNR